LCIVQEIPREISVDIEPNTIFPIDSEIRFNCKLPESNKIWWTSLNHRRRENNPLTRRIGLDHINRRFICHAKHINGKLYRKMIQIQRYSEDELTAIIATNEMERSSQNNQRKSKEKTFVSNILSILSFS
jgi:hypothetical protein